MARTMAKTKAIKKSNKAQRADILARRESSVPKPMASKYDGVFHYKCVVTADYPFQVITGNATGGFYWQSAAAGGLLGIDSSATFTALQNRFGQYKINFVAAKIMQVNHWGNAYETRDFKLASDPDGDLGVASTDQELERKVDYREYNGDVRVVYKNINVHSFQKGQIDQRGGWLKNTQTPAATPNTVIRLAGFNVPNGTVMFSLKLSYYCSFRDVQ